MGRLTQASGVDEMASGMLQATERLNLADSLREFHSETGRPLLDLVDE